LCYYDIVVYYTNTTHINIVILYLFFYFHFFPFLQQQQQISSSFNKKKAVLFFFPRFNGTSPATKSITTSTGYSFYGYYLSLLRSLSLSLFSNLSLTGSLHSLSAVVSGRTTWWWERATWWWWWLRSEELMGRERKWAR
jgi:hypothetical protein